MNLHSRIGSLEGRSAAHGDGLTDEQRIIRLNVLQREAEHDPEARLRLDRAQRLLNRAAARLAEVKA